MKPLISVNSFVIFPPWSCTCFFAFSSSCGEAPDLRVTYPESVRRACDRADGDSR